MAARLEVLAVGIGLAWLGGPTALYDLPAEEQATALAYALAVSEHPDLHIGPMGWHGLAKLWNDTRPREQRG